LSIDLSHHEILASLLRFVDGMVHPSAAEDPLRATRHRTFIATNLLGGVLALALLPLYIALWGKTDVYVVVAFALVALQTPIALFLSRTGRFETAHKLLAICLSLLIGWTAAISGGVSSVMLFWLLLVPAEAALSGSRRVVAFAAAATIGALAAVFALDAMSLVPAEHAFVLSDTTLQAIIIIGGVIYGTLIALRSEILHRRAEKLALSQEVRYRLLAENMSDIVSLHTPNGDAVFVSPAVRRVLGVDPVQAQGDGLFKLVHVADRPFFMKTMSDVLAANEPASMEFRARRANGDGGAGSYIWLEMRCAPLDRQDPVTGMAEIVATTRDITARRNQEDELRAAREAAEMASKAKTRFLASISHELRTPLNAIIGFSEILSQPEVMGAFDADQQVQYARLIHESGHHLLQVVSDILDVSKIESGNFTIVPEPFDIAAVIDKCRQMVGPQAEQKGISLTMEIGDNVPELVADRRACKQVLLNLLSNAVKFSDQGGTVTVGVRREGTRIALYVTDNGIGIAKEDIPKLGSPFFQADSGYDRRSEGTGLGLSVVQGLVALHGGSFDIQSKLGKGTTVTVHLPINCEAAAEPIDALRKDDKPVGAIVLSETAERKTA